MAENNTSGKAGPGPEHRRLDVFVGEWNTEGESTASPYGPAVRITGTDSYEWLPGGFFLLHRVDVRMGDEEIKAIEIIGYDASSGTYPTHSYDNQGNSGTYEAIVRDGIWTFRGDGQRATVAAGDDGKSLTVHWEYSSDGSNWLPWMEVHLTRAE